MRRHLKSVDTSVAPVPVTLENECGNGTVTTATIEATSADFGVLAKQVREAGCSTAASATTPS